MDIPTLLAGLQFARERLLASLDAIEKSGQDVNKVLAWRPGPGRAHIGWQAMHCAATHDRYLNVRLLGGEPTDPQLVAAFAGGSTPDDQKVPTLPTIRDTLQRHYTQLRDYVAGSTPADLQRLVGSPGQQRTIAESLLLLTWHEAHHQGQIHLTWNLYKAAHGVA